MRGSSAPPTESPSILYNESTPPPRSVAMNHHTRQHQLSRTSPNLKNYRQNNHQNNASGTAPRMPFNMGRFLHWRSTPTSALNHSKQTPHAKRSNSETSIDSSAASYWDTSLNSTWEDSWTMNYANLPIFPQYNCISSRTSLEVTVPLELLLRRIATFMRVKSITCELKADEGVISCMTPHHTHFMVLLWRRDESDTNDKATSPSSSPPTLIMEIERRQGCAIEMQRLRHALKETIETGQEPSSEAVDKCSKALLKKTICPLIKKLYQLQQQQQQQQQQDPPETQVDVGSSRHRSVHEGLSSCLTLLRSSCEDQQRLGMEGLVYLTDPCGGVDRDLVREVAKSLLQEDLNEGSHDSAKSNSNELRDDFVQYFANLEDLTLFEDDALESVEFSENHHLAVMHSLALEALSHALQVAVESNQPNSASNIESPFVVIDWTGEFWRVITKALVLDVARAVSRPQDAALSCQCLRLLDDLRTTSRSPDARSVMRHATTSTTTPTLSLSKDRWVQYLVRANQYGAAHHLSLERETRNLLERFEPPTLRQSASSTRPS